MINEFTQPFREGKTMRNENFTGTASVETLVEIDEFNCPIWNVIFEPNCRNNWHKHPGGQILLVTEGEGYYQEEGKDRQLIKKGDVIKIPANTKHWHGATQQNKLAHLAIGININKGIVEWLEPVSDSEYNDLK